MDRDFVRLAAKTHWPRHYSKQQEMIVRPLQLCVLHESVRKVWKTRMPQFLPGMKARVAQPRPPKVRRCWNVYE